MPNHKLFSYWSSKSNRRWYSTFRDYEHIRKAKAFHSACDTGGKGLPVPIQWKTFTPSGKLTWRNTTRLKYIHIYGGLLTSHSDLYTWIKCCNKLQNNRRLHQSAPTDIKKMKIQYKIIGIKENGFKYWKFFLSS